MSLELEDIREKKNGVGLYIVIGLLLVGMAGFGTSQFGTGMGRSQPAALTLEDTEISAEYFNRMLSQNRQHYPELDEDNIQQLTLSQMRQDIALVNYLEKYPLSASNQTIDNIIRGDLRFQDNGKFSEEVFRKYVHADPKSYRNSLSRDLSKQSFQNTVLRTAIASEAELAPYKEMQNLNRDISVAKISRANFAALAEDPELQQFYEKNKPDYMTDEQVSIEYVDFNPEVLVEKVTVSEEELVKFNQSLPRSVNYYLFSDEGSAQSVFAEVDGGKAISEAIKSSSIKVADEGQLENLERVATSESLLPQDSLDAIFSLGKKGQVTAPISVDGDFYLFELVTAVNAELDEKQRSMAIAELKKNKMSELSNRLDKVVHGEKSVDLNTIAESTGLLVQRTGLYSLHGGESILALPELRDAIQAGEKNLGGLQDPVEIGDRVIVYRLIEVKKPEQKSFDVVKEEIKERIIAEKVDEQLSAATDKFMEQVKVDGLIKAAANNSYPSKSFANFTGEIANDNLLDPISANLILRQSAAPGKENVQKVISVTGDVLVYVNTDVRLNNNVSDELNNQLRHQLPVVVGQLELEVFLKSISSNADIKVSKDLFEGSSAMH